LEVLKGKPIKLIIKIMPHLKLSKNMFLGPKKLNYNSCGLLKIWSNFNDSKIPNC
jgi:hypothetical protein